MTGPERARRRTRFDPIAPPTRRGEVLGESLGMRSAVQETIHEIAAGSGSGDSPESDGASLVRAPIRAAYSFADPDRAVIFPIRHETLYKLAGWKVSVVAMSGMTFELDTPHGRNMATLLAGIAQFESDLLSERVKSGLAAARARGKKLGRQPGQRPKSDRLAPMVLHAIDGGRSYRWIARDLGISKNTVTDIVKRHRANP